jgi:hypothetical protein
MDRLLDVKDTAHYGVIQVSGEQLKSALRSAQAWWTSRRQSFADNVRPASAISHQIAYSARWAWCRRTGRAATSSTRATTSTSRCSWARPSITASSCASGCRTGPTPPDTLSCVDRSRLDRVEPTGSFRRTFALPHRIRAEHRGNVSGAALPRSARQRTLRRSHGRPRPGPRSQRPATGASVDSAVVRTSASGTRPLVTRWRHRPHRKRPRSANRATPTGSRRAE